MHLPDRGHDGRRARLTRNLPQAQADGRHVHARRQRDRRAGHRATTQAQRGGGRLDFEARATEG